MAHVRGGACVVTSTHLSYTNSYVLMNFLPHADAVQSHNFCGSRAHSDPTQKQHFVAFTALLNL